jgi:glyceraldehyde-3-phosphate dehydrogenase/erythrose-4-phosphate dehydrogenase
VAAWLETAANSGKRAAIQPEFSHSREGDPMTVRVFINGFGRIGRNVLRSIVESKRKDIEVVGVNDLGPVETNAHLLRFDSVHGRFPAEVKVDGDAIIVNGKRIRVTAIKEERANVILH